MAPLRAVAQRDSREPTLRLTLEQALAEAARSSPWARAAAAETRGAREALAAVPSLSANPVIALSGSTDFSFGDGAENQAELGVSQSFSLGGVAGARRRQRRADVEVREARALRSSAEVARSVADSFFETARAAEAAEILASIAAELERLATTTRAQADRGQIPAMQADLLAVEAARARAAAEREVGASRSAHAELNLALGRAADAATVPVMDEAPPPLSSAAVAAVRATARRADVAIARAEAREARRRSELARAEGAPDLSVGAFVAREQASFARDDVRYDMLPAEPVAGISGTSYLAGLRLEVGLPFVDVREADARLALGEADAADARALGITRRVEAEVRRSLAEAEAARRAYDALAGAAEPLRRAADLFERSYGAGQITLIDLLAARERLLRARLDLVAARAEWHRAVAHARLATGALR